MPIYIANIISQLLDQNSQTRTVACIMPAHKKKKKKKTYYDDALHHELSSTFVQQ